MCTRGLMNFHSHVVTISMLHEVDFSQGIASGYRFELTTSVLAAYTFCWTKFILRIPFCCQWPCSSDWRRWGCALHHSLASGWRLVVMSEEKITTVVVYHQFQTIQGLKEGSFPNFVTACISGKVEMHNWRISLDSNHFYLASAAANCLVKLALSPKSWALDRALCKVKLVLQ